LLKFTAAGWTEADIEVLTNMWDDLG